MKKSIFFLLFLSLSLGTSYAKWVRFTVDMSGQTINPNGIHLSGNFQELLGFPGGDWNPGSTTMARMGTSDMYFVTLNMPAFRKYEYKVVNGNQFYEAEFVPEMSRVGYEFNDNRWIYVDSLNTDTTLLPAILFGGNAPAGQKMMRIYVDMSQNPSAEKVYVSGTFNGFSENASRLYSFGNNLYETMVYNTAGVQAWKFRTPQGLENLSGTCTNAEGNRFFDLQTDTLLDQPCYQSCQACVTSLASALPNQKNLAIASNNLGLQVQTDADGQLQILDLQGRRLTIADVYTGENQVRFTSKGLYLVQFQGNGASTFTSRKIWVP
jgi:hypothetical protein